MGPRRARDRQQCAASDLTISILILILILVLIILLLLIIITITIIPLLLLIIIITIIIIIIRIDQTRGVGDAQPRSHREQLPLEGQDDLDKMQ